MGGVYERSVGDETVQESVRECKVVRMRECVQVGA
jgi:hypothetical protein